MQLTENKRGRATLIANIPGNANLRIGSGKAPFGKMAIPGTTVGSTPTPPGRRRRYDSYSGGRCIVLAGWKIKVEIRSERRD